MLPLAACSRLRWSFSLKCSPQHVHGVAAHGTPWLLMLLLCVRLACRLLTWARAKL